MQKILGSMTFQRARRSSQLLQYLVETTLAGREQDLKEFTIATAVFGRADSFDSRIDSLVRVEAVRLRTRLERYYAIAGPGDPVQIILTAGSYVPLFKERNATAQAYASGSECAAEADAGSVAGPNGWWTGRYLRLGLALPLVLAATAVLATRLKLSNPPRPHITATQRVSVPGGIALSPVLSPDGKSLFYTSTGGDTRLRIWRQSLPGGSAQPLTPPDWDAFELDLSPNGRLLAYRSTRAGGGIYIQPATGGAEVFVVAAGRSPRFSADGKRLLVWVQEPHTSFGKAYSIALSGHDELVPIAAEFADAHNPQWTPDGRVILCGTLRSNVKAKEHDLWVVPASGDGAPVKTGIAELLAGHGIALHRRPLDTTMFQWHVNTLVFVGVHQGETALYSLAMKPGDWIPAGEPRLLEQEQSSWESPSLRGNRIAFTSTVSNLNLYRIPLRADGAAAGEPAPLTREGGNEFCPSLSIDGHYLVYLAKRPPDMQLWKRDMLTGLQTELFRGAVANRLKLSQDGTRAFFPQLGGPPPPRREIHEVVLSSGRIRKVCHDCGLPTSVSFSGDLVVYQTGARLSRLATLDVATGEKREFLRHPHHAVLAGQLSPDGHWLAFELDRGPDGTQLFVAPFRGGALIAETEWFPVSEARFSNYEPAWSPDGRMLYCLSERNGTLELWMQRLDMRTKHATGAAELVHQFRNARLMPQNMQTWQPPYAGLSIGPGNAVLALAELSSEIWLGTFQP